MKRIREEGHEVGNHGWRDEKSVLRGLGEVEGQVRRVEGVVGGNESGCGRKWFRPGGGFFTGGMVRRVEGLGYRVVLGCIYPHDVSNTVL